MRQGEILFLTWGQVDLRDGFIRLDPEHTKTNEGRLVPLNGELVEMLRAMPRGLPGVRVFPYKGKAFGSTFQRAFETARKQGQELKISPFTICGILPLITGDYRAMIFSGLWQLPATRP